MRRGQAEFIEWFPRVLLTIIAFIILVMLVRYYAEHDMNAERLHTTSYLARATMDVLVYTDPDTGRNMPGMIDMAKFTNDNLNDVFVEDKQPASIAGEFTAESTQCSINIKIYNNEDTYNYYYPFAVNNVKGPQSATIRTEKLPVTFIRGTEHCTGILTVNIVRANA